MRPACRTAHSSSPQRATRYAHTVWFMRQAGRSLPEYRARRGDGSILDAIKQPDLAAELTLQPVQRYGVDAAVLYSDIVVPAHAVGFGIDVAPGTGPVCEAPLRTSADLDRLRPFDPEADTPVRAADRQDPCRGAPRFGTAAGVRRRSLHGRQLPHRGPAEPHLRAHQAADAHRRCPVASGDGAADPTLDRRRSPASSITVPRAFQLFDSWAGALSRRRLRHVRAAALHGGLCRARRQPSRTRRESTSASVAITCSSRCTPPAGRARARLAHIDHRRASPHGTPSWSCRATSTRRWCSRVSRQRWPEPTRCLTDNAGADGRAHPGHIFNLGHGVQPDTDPDVLHAVVDHVKASHRGMTESRTAVMLMGYGTPRTPADILPYYTDIRRGRPPTDQQLAELTARYDAIGGISPLAERTEAQRAAMQPALDDIAPGGYLRLARHEACRTVHRGVRRRARHRRLSSVSSGWSWRPTTRRSPSASTSIG